MSEQPQLQVFGLMSLIAGLTLVMGLLMVSGRWRSPVLKFYPGAGVGLVFISLAFIVGSLSACVAVLWPLASPLFMPMMGLAGVFALYGFVVGYFPPRRLLPRWQREQLANNEEDAGR